MEDQKDNNGRFQKGMKRSEESRRRQSETMRRKYANGERTTWSEGKTKETDPRLAAAAEKKKGKIPWTEGKKAKDYPEWNKAVQEAAAKRKASGWKMPDEAKKKLSDHWKARPDETRRRRAEQRFVREGNGLEQLVWAAFDKLGVLYTKNPRIYGASGKVYKADIVIGNVDVECDGTFFHSPTLRPWQVEHDVKRDADLQKNGYRVIRLKEADIRRDPIAQAMKVREVLLSQPCNGTDTSQPNGNTQNHSCDS